MKNAVRVNVQNTSKAQCIPAETLKERCGLKAEGWVALAEAIYGKPLAVCVNPA